MKKSSILFALLLFGAFTLINAQNVNVTFQVDMSVQAAKGAFNPASDGVSVRGSFNDWGETAMTDDDGDSVYVATVEIAANSSQEYKFFHSGNGGTWEDGANKTLDVGAADTTLAVAFFNGEEMPSGNPASVTFNVDMRIPIRKGDLDPSNDTVRVAGSFNGWSTSANDMTDDDGDSTYTVTVDTINSAQLIKFKFIFVSGSSGAVTWETISDRSYWVVDGAQEFSAFWDDIDPDVQLADGNITFTVDMSVMSEVGIYDNAADSLQVRGGFNGWSDAEPDKSLMQQNFLNPDEWFLTVPFVQTPVGSEQNWKFFVKKADPNTIWTDGWERPFSQGGGNRDVNFEGGDQNLDPLYYDDVLPNFVIEAGKSVEITLSVDMTAAADPNVQPLPFDKNTDTVYVVFEQPSFVFSQGWVDTDEMRVLSLSDDDGDMVYTGTLVINGPSWNGIEYRYAYSSPTNGWIAEPAGFGDFAYRVRYVAQEGYRKFVQPYAAPQDHWTAQEDKSDQWEAAPSGDYTGIKDLGGVPLKFELSQNYPNPFNPSTLIKFTIPKENVVSLKIYDVIGQEVATLVNRKMKAGNYQYTFNANALSSGVYFYTLKAGNHVATKKMILLR